jgi:hypothetical protein
MNSPNLKLQVSEDERQAVANLSKNLDCVSCSSCSEWWKIIVLLFILCIVIYYFKVIKRK